MSSTELTRLSPAQRQVAGVLAESCDLTILEITASAGVSKSTVTKALALLESAGAAARTIHTDGDVRFADTWSPTVVTGQLVMSSAMSDGSSNGHPEERVIVEADGCVVAAESETTVVQPEEEEDVTAADERDDLSAAAVAADVEAEPGAAQGRLGPGGLAKLVTEILADNPFSDYTPAMLSHLLNGRSSGAISNLCGSSEDGASRPRRAKGELRSSVAEVLAARPDLELSPVEIANVLGASAGAVANALDRLVTDGVATMACERPRKFRSAGS